MKLAFFSLAAFSLSAGMMLEAGELRLLPHELSWSDKPALLSEPVIEGMTIRAWMAASVFPEFKFSGTLEEAISCFMSASKAVTPGGKTIGSFVIKGENTNQDLATTKIDIHLKGKNSLEVIDAICGAAKTTWTLRPFSILVGAPAKKPTDGQDRSESATDPFAPNIKDGKSQSR